MDEDDAPVGEPLGRRRAVRLLGAPALAWFAGCSDEWSASEPRGAGAETTETPPPAAQTATGPATVATPSGTATACAARPELTAGPFYVDDEENPRRSDLRTDTETGTTVEGVRLDLTVAVHELTADGCRPLPEAVVDVWHADARGTYSDVDSEGTVGRDFLRGHQFTDDEGAATFTTVYPGWYPGRTPHVHLRVRSPAAGSEDTASSTEAARYDFVTQLFFREERTDAVYGREPYAARPERDTVNDQDAIYLRGGPELVLDLRETDEGLAGEFHLALTTDHPQ